MCTGMLCSFPCFGSFTCQYYFPCSVSITVFRGQWDCVGMPEGLPEQYKAEHVCLQCALEA